MFDGINLENFTHMIRGQVLTKQEVQQGLIKRFFKFLGVDT